MNILILDKRYIANRVLLVIFALMSLNTWGYQSRVELRSFQDQKPADDGFMYESHNRKLPQLDYWQKLTYGAITVKILPKDHNTIAVKIKGLYSLDPNKEVEYVSLDRMISSAVGSNTRFNIKSYLIYNTKH